VVVALPDTVPQFAVVPSVVRYLPALPVWEGREEGMVTEGILTTILPCPKDPREINTNNNIRSRFIFRID
jgi:hypothetical protein